LSLFIRLSTQVLTDAKIISAGPEATVLWIKGLLYAKEHLTDGIVPADALPLISIGLTDVDSAVKRLIQIDLWAPCAEGYTVGSERWARHQTTKVEVETIRAANRERKRKSRERQQSPSQTSHAVTPSPEHRAQSQSTEPEQKQEKPLARSGEGDAVTPNSNAPLPALFPAAPPWIEFPTNRPGELFPVLERQIAEWAQLYPAVDIEQQLRNMRGWLDSRPTERKTFNGMSRFVTRWLQREQDDTRPKRNGGADGARVETFAERKQANTIGGGNGAVAILQDRARAHSPGGRDPGRSLPGVPRTHGH
jgi:hypothetical protein